MTDIAFLGAIISVVAINITMLALVLRQMMNGRPRQKNNPGAIDPDDVRLGDVSLAYFRAEFVEPIIEAINRRSGDNA